MEDRRMSVMPLNSDLLHIMDAADPDLRLELGMFYIDEEIAELRRNARRPLPGPSLVDRADSLTKKLSRIRHR